MTKQEMIKLLENRKKELDDKATKYAEKENWKQEDKVYARMREINHIIELVEKMEDK